MEKDEPPHEGEILILAISQGKKWDEKSQDGAIGSIDRCIVFAPKGAVPGQNARLKLAVMRDRAGAIRTDSGGRPMYTARRAPVEYVDRWRENGDGTLSRVTFAVDWLLRESEEGVCETRAPAQRESQNPNIRAVYRLVWGSSISDSAFECRKMRVFLQMEERVQNGALVWLGVGERLEPDSSEVFPTKSFVVSGGNWVQRGLQPVYPADTTVQLSLKYEEEGRETAKTVEHTWETLPAWLQDEMLIPYPLCGCSRQRSHPNNRSDGYGKCELCRNEETCDRCGQTPKRVKIVAGRRICSTCESMAVMEALVESQVSGEARIKVAATARNLLAGRAMERKLGEMVLAATLDHLPEGIARDRVAQAGAGYGWYYVTSDGTYGSKFSPEALEILQCFDRAKGDGLVLMTAWLGGHQKFDDCERMGDFYHRSQVKGESLTPNFSLVGSLSVSVRLRGTEADRQAASAGYRRLVESQESESDEAREIREILSDNEQDFAAALLRIKAAEQALESLRMAEEAALSQRQTVEVSFGGPTNREMADGFWTSPKSIPNHDGELRLIDKERDWVKGNVRVAGMTGVVVSVTHTRGYHGGYVSVTVAVVPGSAFDDPEPKAPLSEEEAAERLRLQELLAWGPYGGESLLEEDLGLAKRIDAFVKEAIGIRGKAAHRLLSEEDEEAYGRGARTSAISRKFPGIDHHGLDWAHGRDIMPVVFWAERLSANARKPPRTDADPKPASAEQVTTSLDALRSKFGKKR